MLCFIKIQECLKNNEYLGYTHDMNILWNIYTFISQMHIPKLKTYFQSTLSIWQTQNWQSAKCISSFHFFWIGCTWEGEKWHSEFVSKSITWGKRKVISLNDFVSFQANVSSYGTAVCRNSGYSNHTVTKQLYSDKAAAQSQIYCTVTNLNNHWRQTHKLHIKCKPADFEVLPHSNIWYSGQQVYN